MKLIIGLGNPGRTYQATRHNVGFDVLGELARKSLADEPKEKFDGLLAESRLAGERALLLWPQTYMNLSGTSAGKVRDFYKIDDSQVLVVCDDFNLPLAKLRFRARGSDGGQKGLADILRRFGTNQIQRLRIGIGPVPPQWEAANFVLSKFTTQEGQDIEQCVRRAATAVEDWAQHGIEYCMNVYN